MPKEDKHILKLDRKVDALRLNRSFESSSEGRKVIDEVFDRLTLGVIFKLTCEKRIATVDFPVSTGKEGNVFRATAPDGTRYAIVVLLGNTTARIPERMALMQAVSRAVAANHR